MRVPILWRALPSLFAVCGIVLLACSSQEPDSSSAEKAEADADSAGMDDIETARISDGPLFVEASAVWGVEITHDAGAAGGLRFPEMMGGGVAIFDADGDGDLDLYFVNGAPEIGGSQDPTAPANRLFLQGESGRFVEASDGSGLDDRGYGTGVAVGDYDNDGIEDVFLSNIGQDRLFRGLGDGTFEDVSDRAGIPGGDDPRDEWSTSAAFCDFDRNGFLDLYVVAYVIYDETVTCSDLAGRPEYCGPDNFVDQVDTLLMNQGDGTFVDATRSAGIDQATGAGLGVVCNDLDDDGWMDIYVANDGDPNQLWMNQRDGTFVDDALIMGASVNAAGVHEAGMGIIAADFDNDADLDLFLTHLRDETNTFYRNLGAGSGFEDQTVQVGLAASSAPYTGFGTVPLDMDLDGDLDLVVSNGRVKRGAPLTESLDDLWNPYAEPNLVYQSVEGRFSTITEGVGDFVEPIEVGRSLAVGDLDADGDLDLVLTNLGSPSRLLRSEAKGHWLLVDAVDPRLGRRAIGARVTLELGARRWVRTIQGAMSYLSSSDPRAHFGLGAVEEDESVRVVVRWPDGLEESFEGGGVDRVVVLERGEGTS